MSVISGVVGASASKSAAGDQADAIIQAAQIAADTQMKMFNKGAKLTEPWRVAGAEALNTLAAKIAEGPGEFDYEKSPGYEFRMEEGLDAVESSAAARGGLLSGRATKELNRFAQGTAAQDYNKEKSNFLREYYESLTPLQSLAGVGQSTASQTAQQAGATGANIGATQYGAGVDAANAIYGGQINATNAILNSAKATTNNALVAYNAWKNRQPSYSASVYSTPNAPNTDGGTYYQGGV